MTKLRRNNIYRTVVLSLLVWSSLSCALLQGKIAELTPDITLKDIKLKSFDFEGADIEYVYAIRNKASFGITFTKLAFVISVDGKRMIDAANDKNIVIKANETTDFSIVQRVRYVETVEAILEFSKKDQVDIALQGKVGIFINDIFGSVEVPIEGTKTVPVPKLPQVAFGSLDFDTMNFSNPLNPKASFTLKFNVRNTNPFEIKLPKLEYDFSAAGTQVVAGSKTNQILAKQSDSQILIPINLSGRSIIELVPKLRDLNSTDYRFTSAVEFAIMEQTLRLPFYYPK